MLSDDFENDVYRLAFALNRGVLPPLASSILERVGSERAFFEMSETELSAILGFRNRIFDSDHRRDLIERARREAEYIHAHGITPLYLSDPDYPPLLAEADDAPLVLFTLGGCRFAPSDSDPDTPLMLAVVGTRHATAYGVDFTTRLIHDLAAGCARPVVIVSGLAYGIDVAAHRAALAEGLPTVAVVAHGLNTIYPADHRSVAVEIVNRGGAILTEYTSADPIHKGNFLARNRIVAGMCQALVVSESAEKGGALVTARLAAGYNREVFALPGRTTDRYSRGCNALIARNQASLITDAGQLIDALRWPRRDGSSATDAQPALPLLEGDEALLYDYLSDHPDSHLNDIAIALDIPLGRLNGILLELEFRSLVIRKPGGRFVAKT